MREDEFRRKPHQFGRIGFRGLDIAATPAAFDLDAAPAELPESAAESLEDGLSIGIGLLEGPQRCDPSGRLLRACRNRQRNRCSTEKPDKLPPPHSPPPSRIDPANAIAIRRGGIPTRETHGH